MIVHTRQSNPHNLAIVASQLREATAFAQERLGLEFWEIIEPESVNQEYRVVIVEESLERLFPTPKAWLRFFRKWRLTRDFRDRMTVYSDQAHGGDLEEMEPHEMVVITRRSFVKLVIELLAIKAETEARNLVLSKYVPRGLSGLATDAKSKWCKMLVDTEGTPDFYEHDELGRNLLTGEFDLLDDCDVPN